MQRPPHQAPWASPKKHQLPRPPPGENDHGAPPARSLPARGAARAAGRCRLPTSARMPPVSFATPGAYSLLSIPRPPACGGRSCSAPASAGRRSLLGADRLIGRSGRWKNVGRTAKGGPGAVECGQGAAVRAPLGRPCTTAHARPRARPLRKRALERIISTFEGLHPPILLKPAPDYVEWKIIF